MHQLINAEPLAPRCSELRSQRLSLEAYYRLLKRRVKEVDPQIEAFVTDAPDWNRVSRRRVTLEQAYDPDTTPLYGIPVGVKDIFHVAGMATHAGSSVPPEVLTGSEGSVIESLRDAGAVFLGKTVTAEFAYFEPGPTRNPHGLDHTPGGSSSGSAAAVAAGLCPLALGTQTIGSIGRPAAFCGIVGVKPSYERISTDGLIDAAPSVDHVGYFTQDVQGARMAGPVIYDDWTPATPRDELILGAVEGPYLQQAEQTARTHFDKHLEALAEAGYEIRRIDPFEAIETTNQHHQTLVAAEMALTHSDWYPEFGDQYAAATASLIEQGRDHSVEAVMEARRHRHRLRSRLHEQFNGTDIDVLVSPAAPGPAPQGLSSTGDPVMNLPWTHAGLPTVVFPASVSDTGLPLGLQCTAPFGADEQLLADAVNLKQAVTSCRS